MPKLRHTPESAARAIRAMFESQNRIAKTWDDHDAQAIELQSLPPAQRPMGGTWLNAYKATKLVQEQCNGIDRSAGRVADGPYSFQTCSLAVAEVIPEVFCEYWEELRVTERAALAA